MKNCYFNFQLTLARVRAAQENPSTGFFKYAIFIFLSFFMLQAAIGQESPPTPPSRNSANASPLTGQDARGGCCGQGNGIMPCHPLPLLIPGQEYLIYITFTLNGGETHSITFSSLDIDIIKPGGTQIIPENVEYFSVANGNVGRSVSTPINVPAGLSRDYVAFTYFKFSPTFSGDQNDIEPGTYTFRIIANGMLGNLGLPFSVFGDSYFNVHVLDPGEPCGNFDPLEAIGGIHNPTKTQVHPILGPKWFPNPTQSNAILEFDLIPDTEVNIEIMDVQGRVLLRPQIQQAYKTGKQQKKIDVSRLPSGIYYTRITTKGETQVIKWVKLE